MNGVQLCFSLIVNAAQLFRGADSATTEASMARYEGQSRAEIREVSHTERVLWDGIRGIDAYLTSIFLVITNNNKGSELWTSFSD